MQPNKNLVFYLAGDENEIGDASKNQASASSTEKNNDLQPEVNELDVTVLDASQAKEAKVAEFDEVDWIATLENIRHQRRGDDGHRQPAGGPIELIAEGLEGRHVHLELQLAATGRAEQAAEVLGQAG